MTMSYGEKIAYQRGYSRGRTRVYAHAVRLLEIAKGYRERCVGQSKVRICKNCSRWKRGAPCAVWGSCRADFEFALEGRMWVDAAAREAPAIITTEDFGCINWIPI
jgi:hypothetical protein